MGEHAAQAAEQDAAMRQYVQQAAAPSPADELAKLAARRHR
jgi:hypothetical protein